MISGWSAGAALIRSPIVFSHVFGGGEGHRDRHTLGQCVGNAFVNNDDNVAHFGNGEVGVAVLTRCALFTLLSLFALFSLFSLFTLLAPLTFGTVLSG